MPVGRQSNICKRIVNVVSRFAVLTYGYGFGCAEPQFGDSYTSEFENQRGGQEPGLFSWIGTLSPGEGWRVLVWEVWW